MRSGEGDMRQIYDLYRRPHPKKLLRYSKANVVINMETLVANVDKKYYLNAGQTYETVAVITQLKLWFHCKFHSVYKQQHVESGFQMSVESKGVFTCENSHRCEFDTGMTLSFHIVFT